MHRKLHRKLHMTARQRPGQLVARAYLWRGARVWFLARSLATGLFLLAGSDPVQLPVASIGQLVLLTVVLGFLDTHLRHEWALLGNLAVGPRKLALFFALPAVGGELLVWFVAGIVS